MSFGRVQSILAGSYIFYLGGLGPFWRVQSYVIHCTSEFNRHGQTDRQTDNIESFLGCDVRIYVETRDDVLIWGWLNNNRWHCCRCDERRGGIEVGRFAID
jgi:hypothetical protein